MSKAITISYDLHPPADLQHPELASTKEHGFSFTPIPLADQGPTPTQSQTVIFYDGLRGALAEAKETLGAELTAWRDAVGNREAVKEAKKSGREGEEGEDIDGEEEGE